MGEREDPSDCEKGKIEGNQMLSCSMSQNPSKAVQLSSVHHPLTRPVLQLIIHVIVIYQKHDKKLQTDQLLK